VFRCVTLSPLAAMLAADVVAVHVEAAFGARPELSLLLDADVVELSIHRLEHPTASKGTVGHLLVAVLRTAVEARRG